MSRGPGDAQRRVLDSLAVYDHVGPSLGWEWDVGRSSLRTLADKDHVAAYRAGERIEIWKLRRDTALSASELSRALRSLRGRGFVSLFCAYLDVVGYDDHFPNAEFARITSKGVAWLKETAGSQS